MSAQPPRDDDRVPLADIQESLELELHPRLDPPQPWPQPPDPPLPVRPTGPDLDDIVPSWIPQFAQRVAEVVGGDRPAHQLVRWTTEGVYADLVYRANLTARAGGYEPGRAKVQLLRPIVMSAHPRPVDDNTFEVAIVIRYGERRRALAARFGRIALAWRCTAIDFGERASGRQA